MPDIQTPANETFVADALRLARRGFLSKILNTLALGLAGTTTILYARSAPLPAAEPTPLDLGDRPISIPVTWADGTPFRVTVYSFDQWDRLPLADRPRAWLDESERAYVAFTADNPPA